MNCLEPVVNPYIYLVENTSPHSLVPTRWSARGVRLELYTIGGGQCGSGTYHKLLTARGRPTYKNHLHRIRKEYPLSMQGSLRSQPQGKHIIYQVSKNDTFTERLEASGQASEKQMDANLRRSVCWRHSEKGLAKVGEWWQPRQSAVGKLKLLA